MPRQQLNKRTKAPKGPGLPNKSPKLNKDGEDDVSDEPEVVAISSDDNDAEIEADSSVAELAGEDDEDDDADDEFIPGDDEEDIEPLLLSAEEAPLLAIGDPAQEVERVAGTRSAEEKNSLVSLVEVLVAELNDTISKATALPNFPEGDGGNIDEENDSEAPENGAATEGGNVVPAAFSEMIDDITVAPPEIAWRLAAKAVFLLPRPYLPLTSAALETILFSWKAQQQGRWLALTDEQRAFIRNTIFARPRPELGMLVRAMVASEATSSGKQSETLALLAERLREKKEQTPNNEPDPDDALSDEDEGTEGLWRFVPLLLTKPNGYGPRELPVAGAWHRPDLSLLSQPLAESLWNSAQTRLKKDELLLRLPVWMSVITLLPLLAQQVGRVEADDFLALRVEQWASLDPQAVADLTAAVLRSPPLRAHHRQILLDSVVGVVRDHKGFAHLDGNSEPSEEDVQGLLSLMQALAAAGEVLTYSWRHEAHHAEQIISTEFVRTALVPRLVDLLSHANIGGAFADRRLVSLDPADVGLLLGTVRATVTSVACTATLQTLLDAARSFSTRTPLLAALFVAFSRAPQHAPSDLLKSIEELLSRSAILLNMLENEELKQRLLLEALHSCRKGTVESILSSVTAYYPKLKYLGNAPSLPRAALATDFSLPGCRDTSRLIQSSGGDDENVPPELFAEPPAARICFDVARIAWARAVAWSPSAHWRFPPEARKALITLSLVRSRLPVLKQLPKALFHTLVQHCAALYTRSRTWEEHAKALYPNQMDRIDTFLQLATASNVRRGLVIRLSLCEDAAEFLTAQKLPKPKPVSKLKGGTKRRPAIRR